MPKYQFFDFLVIGQITTEYIVDLNGTSHEDILGGSLLYAAGGLRCWADRIALVSQPLPTHREELLDYCQRYDLDHSGIQWAQNDLDDRVFLGYKTAQYYTDENPVAFYAFKKLAFPRGLLRFSRRFQNNQNRQNANLPPPTIPSDYWNISSTLILAANIKTQLQLSASLQTAAIKKIVLQSSPNYMQADFFEQIPALMKDITVFVTTTSELVSLFQNRIHKIADMAQYLNSLGCGYLVLNDPDLGQTVFDIKANNTWQIPNYPTSIVDPTGMQEAFCGGLLAGYRLHFDPLEACLYGNVSSSFTGEGTGPFFATEADPTLIQYRLENLKGLVKKL
jgi:sugar/nucleoside kinase (ribokinase family)